MLLAYVCNVIMVAFVLDSSFSPDRIARPIELTCRSASFRSRKAHVECSHETRSISRIQYCKSIVHRHYASAQLTYICHRGTFSRPSSSVPLQVLPKVAFCCSICASSPEDTLLLPSGHYSPSSSDTLWLESLPTSSAAIQSLQVGRWKMLRQPSA